MSPPTEPESWARLGAPAPRDLADARLQLHWAVQPVAAIGYTYLPPRPDWSHTSLSWDPAHAVLTGGPTRHPVHVRAALRPADLSLLLLADDELLEQPLVHPLNGFTLDEAYAWLAGSIAGVTGGMINLPLNRPAHELPDHPVAHDAPFRLTPPDAFAELARWYANAELALRPWSAPHRAGASPVRCWPHHFDIAALITLDRDRDPETARSIGVGLSPGDGSYAQPYFYASPWPRPAAEALPPLDDPGAWHTEGWTGAVLTGDALVAAGPAEAQHALAAAFLSAAVEACEALLAE